MKEMEEEESRIMEGSEGGDHTKLEEEEESRIVEGSEGGDPTKLVQEEESRIMEGSEGGDPTKEEEEVEEGRIMERSEGGDPTEEEEVEESSSVGDDFKLEEEKGMRILKLRPQRSEVLPEHGSNHDRWKDDEHVITSEAEPIAYTHSSPPPNESAEHVISIRHRAPDKSSQSPRPSIVEMRVHMDCDGCQRKVKKALSKLEGVKTVEIDMNLQKVTVIGLFDQKKVLKAVRKTRRVADLWQLIPDNPEVSTVSWDKAFAIFNLLLELLSEIFNQISSKGHSWIRLAIMLVSLVTLFVCIAELFYRGRKEKVAWRKKGMICWFRHRDGTPFGTLLDFVAFTCSILQFVFALIAYAFFVKHADYPIKLSIGQLVFAFGMMFSKLLNNTTSVKPNQN